MILPHLAIHADDDSVEATEFRHGYVDWASRMAIPTALLNIPNGKVEQLATNRLALPQDVTASLLQRLVLHMCLPAGSAAIVSFLMRT